MVHRRGYRSIAPVTINESAPAQETGRVPSALSPMLQPPDQHSTPSPPELIVLGEFTAGWAHLEQGLALIFFSAHLVPLRNLWDDLFADDLYGAQDVLLGGHDET